MKRGSALPLMVLWGALACGGAKEEAATADSLARDLAIAGTPAPAARDTLQERREAEFAKCLYVSDRPAALRRCLVFDVGWEPKDAERRIALRVDTLDRAMDSVRALMVAERRRELAARQAAADKEAAERRQLFARLDSSRAEKEARDAAVLLVRSRTLYVSRPGERFYYIADPKCSEAVNFITSGQFVGFANALEAEKAGYRRKSDWGC